jgi:hypothetical protein
MSANFMHKGGLMVGLDLHTYCPIVPPGAEIPIWPHLVGAPFSWPSWFMYFTKKVTSVGHPMIQDGWGLVLLLHIPYPVPLPGPKEAAEYAMMTLTSGSEPVLSIGSVTAEESPLDICVSGCAGWNLNCGPFESDLITGAVLCFSSVQTTPTLSDIVGAAIKVLATSIFAPLVGYFAGKGLGNAAKPIVRKILKQLLRVPYKPMRKLVAKAIKAIPQPLVEFIARFLTKKLADKGTPAVKGKLFGEAHPVAQGIVNAMGI